MENKMDDLKSVSSKDQNDKDRGLVVINTGPGKGKTTAALGVVVRALGHRQKVAFLQFIKSSATGESRFLENLAEKNSDFFYARLGLGFVRDSPTTDDRAKALEAWELAKTLRKKNDLLVLDEINVAVDKGLIPVEELVSFLKEAPWGLNIVLTGRGCPDKIIELADTVTFMAEIKHAYKSGIPARKGLDY
jgi:cob(I)alamin adenosyltransferase